MLAFNKAKVGLYMLAGVCSIFYSCFLVADRRC